MGAKRGNHEGSIYQRAADGRWVAAVTDRRTGKRRSRMAGTREAAAAKLLDLQNEVASGRPRPRALTVASHLDNWVHEVVRPKRQPKTVESYMTHVERHIKPHLGSLPLSDLSQSDVRRWHATLIRDGLSPRSVRNAHAVLRNSLEVAFDDGIVPSNVAASKSARPPQAAKSQRARYADAGDVQKLLAAANEPVVKVLLVLASNTGLRRNELLALRWCDVDFQRRAIHVSHAIQRVKGAGLSLGPPKTGAGRRDVPLSRDAEDALEMALGGRAIVPVDHVVVGETGSPIDPSEASRKVKRVAKAAGSPWLTLHVLRHFFATELERQGVPVFVVQALMGHASPVTTLDVYSHVNAADLRAAVDSVAFALATPVTRVERVG